MKNKEIIRAIAKDCDSFYLYDEETILKNIDTLKTAFPKVHFLYSMKCNPNLHVLNATFQKGFGADAASLGETLKAVELGLAKEEIYYSAPGKTYKDIELAMDKAYLIADSIAELHRIQQVAASKEMICQVGLRINPEYSFDDDYGHFNKFGIDYDQAIDFLKANDCSNIKVNGIHVHLKSQELRTEVLARHYTQIFQLAEEIIEIYGPLDYINLGSGIGVTYGPEEEPVDLSTLSDVVNQQIDLFQGKYPLCHVMMETGRFVACKSGIYVTKVVDTKVSHGKGLVMLKNTLNGFFKPSVAKVIEAYSQDVYPAAAEPLYTCKDAFEMIPLKAEGDYDDRREVVALSGNLCTGMDMVKDEILLPPMEYGDLMVFTNAGSYAAVLSPMEFSSQEKPVELFLTTDKKIRK